MLFVDRERHRASVEIDSDRSGATVALVSAGSERLTDMRLSRGAGRGGAVNVDDHYDAYHFGLPVSDLRYLMRALLACATADEHVFLDLTEIEGRHFAEGEKPVDDALAETTRHGRVCEKILVLTEGHTDTRILTKSLAVLYPHLADMYSFLAYEAFNLGGGTGNLASLVKGLAGVGIRQPRDRHLRQRQPWRGAGQRRAKLNLRENFRILTLPDSSSRSSIRPSARTEQRRADINGRACGIELYLGMAALTGQDGELIRVQWGGYEAKVKRYQSELMDKKRRRRATPKSARRPENAR